MIKSFLITAALDLGLLEQNTAGYGMSDTHITLNGTDLVEIDSDLEAHAEVMYKRHTLRVWRNQQLMQTDWAVLPDALADNPGLKQQMIEYRQILRDLPSTIVNSTDPIVYPLDPSKPIIRPATVL